MQLSSEYAFASETHTIESQDRLWEVEEILQTRIVKGRGLRAKRAQQYLIQWTPSWLSTEELPYARKTWKIIKTSRLRRQEKDRILYSNRVRVHWASSWISATAFGPIIQV